jgi:hypothetical protein
MKTVEALEILDIAQYERVRPDFRRRVIDLKKERRVSVGPQVTFVFENHDTVLFQIQEMMRAERLVNESAIQHEIDTYNELLPRQNQLSATMLIEIQDQSRIRETITQFLGVNTGECVWLQIGEEKLPGIFEAGQSEEGRISAVQYVRFGFSAEQMRNFKARELPVKLVIEHPNYHHQAVLPEPVCTSLAKDFE